jgi:hypothetical protein
MDLRCAPWRGGDRSAAVDQLVVRRRYYFDGAQAWNSSLEFCEIATVLGSVAPSSLDGRVGALPISRRNWCFTLEPHTAVGRTFCAAIIGEDLSSDLALISAPCCILRLGFVTSSRCAAPYDEGATACALRRRASPAEEEDNQ